MYKIILGLIIIFAIKDTLELIIPLGLIFGETVVPFMWIFTVNILNMTSFQYSTSVGVQMFIIESGISPKFY